MVTPLITVAELTSLLHRVVVLDVRWRLLGPAGRDEYDKGHIAGAVFVDLETELSAPPEPLGRHGRHPLPTARDFSAAMRRCGVRGESSVVCYDAADGTSAARAWWLLRYFGHGDVRVLDGGYAAWVAGGGEVSRVATASKSGDFVARAGHLPVLDARDAEDLARVGVLLDAREAGRYAAEYEPVDPVAGHIPGAVSAPTLENVDATGHFFAGHRLRDRFEGLGVTDARPVGTYCGSGVTAAHQVLALELAGFRASLYADSWSGWITDPRRPVATGEVPG
jgi:thiosulfate/3-mercaptopyruvate sulfurtransferase